MKKLALAVLLCGNVLLSHAAGNHPDTLGRLPSKKEILALMRKVNAYQVAHPVTPDDRNWERATWYTGVMGAWKATDDRSFLEQALKWGQQHKWQIDENERYGGNRLFLVQTWLALYLAFNDGSMIEPTITWLDTPAPISPAGAKRWYLEGDHSYCDSLYGASALAMLAKATGNNKYLTIMHAFFGDVDGELFDKEAGLYYRDNRYIGRKTSHGKKVLWSRGNGWVFAGIPRILDYLPQDDPHRAEYLERFRTMAATLLHRQQADGLWRPNLDDPEDVPSPETSGTGFFCYGMAWGINHHILQRKQYLPAVKRAWAGLCRNLSPEGKVLWGQQVDKEPNPVHRDGSREFVTGTFLLAASEVYRLAGGR